MAVKFEATDYKKITLDEMMDFIEKNYPNDKAWFKEVSFQDKDGNNVDKYNHLNAVRQFCKKYAPELLPVAKEKSGAPPERLKKWSYID